MADGDLVNWWMVSGVGGTTERVTLGPLRCGGFFCLPHKPRVYATTIIIMVLTRSDFFYNSSALFVGFVWGGGGGGAEKGEGGGGGGGGEGEQITQ